MYTAQEKANEARREVTYRQFVYSKKVAAGTMQQAEADRKIRLMAEIADEYQKQADDERLI
jgi:hypothetical protein